MSRTDKHGNSVVCFGSKKIRYFRVQGTDRIGFSDLDLANAMCPEKTTYIMDVKSPGLYASIYGAEKVMHQFKGQGQRSRALVFLEGMYPLAQYLGVSADAVIKKIKEYFSRSEYDTESESEEETPCCQQPINPVCHQYQPNALVRCVFIATLNRMGYCDVDAYCAFSNHRISRMEAEERLAICRAAHLYGDSPFVYCFDHQPRPLLLLEGIQTLAHYLQCNASSFAEFEQRLDNHVCLHEIGFAAVIQCAFVRSAWWFSEIDIVMAFTRESRVFAGLCFFHKIKKKLC